MRRRSSAAFFIMFSTKPSWLPRSTLLVSGSSIERSGNCFASITAPPVKPSMTKSVLPANTADTALSISCSTLESQAVTYCSTKSCSVAMPSSDESAIHAESIRSSIASCA